MGFIAHIRESDKVIQTVEEHLIEVKELAEQWGEGLGVKHIAGLAGMLHDLGKYSEKFKEYIINAVNNPDAPSKRGSVDHSTAGGKLLYQYFHKGNFDPYKAILAEVVGNSIISHHSYLQDFLTPNLESDYLKRVRYKEIEDFEKSVQSFFKYVIEENDFNNYVEEAAKELKVYLSKDNSSSPETKLMFLSKFIFSILIDADRTNTRMFEEDSYQNVRTNNCELFEKYYEKLLKKIELFKLDGNTNNRINKFRMLMSDQCDSFAEKPSGIYTLSIPTGGGKTLASLRYALKHAKLYQKQRIIYVVPFTTIIEQNANELRKILGDSENILEHHSNVIEDSNMDDESQVGIMDTHQKLKLAKDSWDSPIIFTTMVQFLNVFYSSGSRNIRRLHNLINSIIIFDEVQNVPVSCVSLFNKALNFLKNYGQSSIILCTATQPALDFVEQKLEINKDGEIVLELESILEAFERVKIIDKSNDETFNNEKLKNFVLESIKEMKSILVILNTKSVVRDLYSSIKNEHPEIAIYHLSTSMCAAHRKQVLDEVKNKLKNNETVICISTPLIEAGVDISFECVIRSLSGLDSIAQAAGRCNRHGEREIGKVYIIDHEEENLNHLIEVKEGKKISKRILKDIKMNLEIYDGSILSRHAMDKYFQEYYIRFSEDLNYFIPKLKIYMTDLLTAPSNHFYYHKAYISKFKSRLPLFIVNSYKTAADYFQVIDDKTTTVIVPYGEGKEIISELNSSKTIDEFSRFIRKAQQFSVNIYSHELDALNQNGGIVRLIEGKFYALKEGAYHPNYGLNIENNSPLNSLVF